MSWFEVAICSVILFSARTSSNVWGLFLPMSRLWPMKRDHAFCQTIAKCGAWKLEYVFQCAKFALQLCLLVFFATPEGLSANFWGNFVPPQTSLSLVEGDIAVPGTGHGQALDAFLTEPSALWPRGFIPYRIETFEWDGIVEPIFLDDQIENITTALGKIMTSVPCLKFQ